TYKKLPLAYGYTPLTFTANQDPMNPLLYTGSGITDGTAFFFILPFIDQDNIYKASDGTFTFTQTSTGNIYQITGKLAANVNAPVGVFQSPSDISLIRGDNTAESQVSYLASRLVLDGQRTLTQISDGTSNTLMYMEGYSNGCTNQNTGSTSTG